MFRDPSNQVLQPCLTKLDFQHRYCVGSQAIEGSDCHSSCGNQCARMHSQTRTPLQDLVLTIEDPRGPVAYGTCGAPAGVLLLSATTRLFCRVPS